MLSLSTSSPCQTASSLSTTSTLATYVRYGTECSLLLALSVSLTSYVHVLYGLQFVRELIHDLVESASKDDDADSPFLVLTGRSQPSDPVGSGSSDAHEPPPRQLFIDTGVYTRNRMFRVLGSSKFRRDAVLRHLPLHDARGPSTDTSSPSLPPSLSAADLALFLETLVCPYPTREAFDQATRTHRIRLLRCDLDDSTLYRSDGTRPLWAPPLASSSAVSSRRPHAQAVESRESLFPRLDAFILAQATTGGVQGIIRVVQMLYDDVAVHLPDTEMAAPAPVSMTEQPTESASADNTTDPVPLPEVSTRKQRAPWMLVYHMARNRWCHNVQRAHKSNNVMFIVDLEQRTWYQKCHDQRCRATDYRCVLHTLSLVLTHIDSLSHALFLSSTGQRLGSLAPPSSHTRSPPVPLPSDLLADMS